MPRGGRSGRWGDKKGKCRPGRIGTPGHGRKIQRAKENIAKTDQVDSRGKDKIRVAVSGGKFGRGGREKTKFRSSNVDYIAYNRSTKQLDVAFKPSNAKRFRNGAAYRIQNVSSQRATALIRSGSKGKYFWTHLRDPGRNCRKGAPQRRIR